MPAPPIAEAAHGPAAAAPPGGPVYRGLARGLAALQRRGWPAALARIDAGELRGYALAFDYMLKATAWKHRRGEPSWPAIQARWARAVGDTALRDRLAGTLHADDRFELIADGPAGFERRAALYAGASRSIDVATYYIQPDETGLATIRAWADCVARGVRVRLLVDRYAMAKKSIEVAGMEALHAALAQAGVQLREWHDPERPHDSTHRKAIVVDGRTALVGGRNFADHYRGTAWRDLDLVLEGPSVAPLATSFEAWWSGLHRPLPPARPWVDHVPADILTDPVMGFVLAAVGAARESVDLELAYFVAHDTLCTALADAARRGVRVRLLTNSAASNDLPYAVWTAYEGARRLLEAGCEVHLRPGAGRTLHCKYVLVDRRWISFGSHNLDYYSPRFVCENNLVVDAPALAERLSDFFDTGVASAEPLTLAAARQWLAGHRARRLYDLVFRDFQ
ncbi:phosphatidylserine/phosphatidylglycerophosphate/cardiolipin synthase family protein [uncultured Piscinibacter sp.]|uniref:phospholipase D-like domain-containing protein n=1 Tax=uncultured Piscinibacter sp. TaxID=1131835 RepID=UPI002614A453|nr:phosphatidylserine/phosphatidylglycerophosphate/cardiolipin synthase family protein [uncultured Piscinibacter sp.]